MSIEILPYLSENIIMVELKSLHYFSESQKFEDDDIIMLDDLDVLSISSVKRNEIVTRRNSYDDYGCLQLYGMCKDESVVRKAFQNGKPIVSITNIKFSKDAENQKALFKQRLEESWKNMNQGFDFILAQDADSPGLILIITSEKYSTNTKTLSDALPKVSHAISTTHIGYRHKNAADWKESFKRCRLKISLGDCSRSGELEVGIKSLFPAWDDNDHCESRFIWGTYDFLVDFYTVEGISIKSEDVVSIIEYLETKRDIVNTYCWEIEV